MLLKDLSSQVRDLDADGAREYFSAHKTGTFTVLDVRTPEEYALGHLPGAKLIPISELADRLDEIEANLPIIAYCASGHRSRAAARLLEGRKFKNIHNLSGGIRSWNGLTAVGPPDSGLILFEGKETPAELVSLIYSLEDGLQRFYRTMAQKTGDDRASQMFGQLAEYEDRHKDRVFGLYLSLADDPVPREAYEQSLESEFMEGGARIEDLIAELGNGPKEVVLILELALGLETQALDLYLRLADKNRNDFIAEIVSQVAEDEKKHMAQLSRLLGGIV